jgi:hypothetical protein
MQIGNAVACRFAYHVGLFLKGMLVKADANIVEQSSCDLINQSSSVDINTLTLKV